MRAKMRTYQSEVNILCDCEMSTDMHYHVLHY